MTYYTTFITVTSGEESYFSVEHVDLEPPQARVSHERLISARDSFHLLFEGESITSEQVRVSAYVEDMEPQRHEIVLRDER